VIVSVLIGAIPAVMVGAHFSSKSADQYIRPVLALILLVSSLGLLGVSNVWLLAVTGCGLLVLAALYLRLRRTRLIDVAVPAPSGAPVT